MCQFWFHVDFKLWVWVYLADNHNEGCVQRHVGCSILQPPSLQSLIFRYKYCIWCHKGHIAGPGRGGDTSAQAGAPRRSWHMSLAICGRRKSRPTLWLASVLHGGGDDRPCSCLVVRNCQVEFNDTPAELGKWKCKHNFHVRLHKSRRCWVPPCKERTRSTLWAAPCRPTQPCSAHPRQTP